jgi:hypothetical protein
MLLPKNDNYCYSKKELGLNIEHYFYNHRKTERT